MRRSNRAGKKGNERFRYSFDMLGEAALTAADAARYFEAYKAAIQSLGAKSRGVESGEPRLPYRSSCRPCIRATTLPGIGGSWMSCCRPWRSFVFWR